MMMLNKICVCILVFCVSKSFGVIYHLNDTEYELLPHLFALDRYEPCTATPGGVYCVANLQLYTDTHSDLYSLIQEYSAHTLKHYNYSVIDRGVCVSSACESYADDMPAEPASALEACLNKTIHQQYGLMARLNYMSCSKEIDEQIRIDHLDYIFLVALLLLLVITCIGSCCRIEKSCVEKNYAEGSVISGKELLICFSVPHNWKRITSVEPCDPRLNIFKGVHGIRTITTMFVILAHSLLLISAGFISDPHTLEKSYESVFMRVLCSGTNVVQVFLLISGMLMAYLLQNTSETRHISWTGIPKIVFLRWWRLTPAAFTTIAFMATWLRHFGSGPLWGIYVADGPSQQCRRFFWTHIFYYNNYVPEDTLCAFHTWYIATDMQLFVVGIVTHFIIRHRSVRCQVMTLTLLLVLGAVTPALHVWWYDLDAVTMLRPELFRTLGDPTLRCLHMLGHNNLPCFVIGMATGYCIYYLQQKKMEFTYPKLGNFVCWCMIPAYALHVYCGSLFLRDGEHPSTAIRMLYAAVDRPLMGAVFAVLMLGCALNVNGLSRSLLEWPGWVLPSRLCYSVYLLHNIFIHILLGGRTQLTPVSFFNMFLMYAGVVVLSFVVALPLCLLVEAPCSRIIKLILAREELKKKE